MSTMTDTPSREVWLARRRRFVTATDIARLANGGPAMWTAVRAEKLTGERTFFGNAWTAWGNEREPFILASLEFLYGVTPNGDTLHVLDGTKWAATPDAVGDGLIGEAKTSVKPLGVDPAELRKTKPTYFDQVQWGMLVRQASECAFAWELTEGTPETGFTPGSLTYFLIPRDEARIAELVAVGERFLEFLAEADDDTSEWDALIAAHITAEAAVKEAQAELDAVKEQIRDRAGDHDVSAARPFGSLSYSLPKPRETFDATAFKTAHPDLHQQFMKTTPPAKRTLRVTPRSEK